MVFWMKFEKSVLRAVLKDPGLQATGSLSSSGIRARMVS